MRQNYFQNENVNSGICTCNTGFEWNGSSCEESPRFEAMSDKTKELLTIVGIIIAVIAALVLFAIIMAYCGEAVECCFYIVFCCCLACD